MNNNHYKIKVSGDKSWRNYNLCRMEISVGQKYHEGDKLKSAIQWSVNNFDRVCLIVADTLQAYNTAFENQISLEEAYKSSSIDGDEWLQRNKDILSSHQLEIFRWSHWRDNLEFENIHKQVNKLYFENSNFRNAVRESVKETWNRRTKNYSHMYRPERELEFFHLSIAYLLEETAVFAMAYKELKGISAYPGSFLEMWSMFIKDNIKGAPAGLNNAHCVRLSFKARKAA